MLQPHLFGFFLPSSILAFIFCFGVFEIESHVSQVAPKLTM